jgi:hypothetical protein
VPHTDFHNAIGPLTYLLVAFGMKIAAPSSSSIVYGSALLLAILLPCAWYIASARIPWALGFLFVVFAGLFLVSPCPPGFGIRETSYAMIYNRQGYVLESILLLSLFLKPRDSVKRSVAIEGLLVGVLLALLFYCKITYFLTAITLMAFAVVLDMRSLRWLLSSVGAFVGVLLAFFAIFHINPHSYLLDIAAAGLSQSSKMRIELLSRDLAGHGTRAHLGGDAARIYILLFCLGVWTLAGNWVGRPRFAVRHLWLVAGAIVAASLLISSGNASQDSGADPLYFVAAIVLLELLRRQNGAQVAHPGSLGRFVYIISLLLMLPIFCGPILARDAASSAYVITWDITKRPAFPEFQRMHSVHLRNFYVPSSSDHITAYWPAREYPARINDGIDLLQKYIRKSDRLTTIALTNPFSFAVGAMPARDGLLWWRPGYSYDKKHHPSAEAFLGDTTLVMIPLVPPSRFGFDTVDVLLGLYGDYLRANFHELASTDTWRLYQRN